MIPNYFIGSAQTPVFYNALPTCTVTEDCDGMHQIALDALHLFNGKIFLQGEINSQSSDLFLSAMLNLAEEGKAVDIYIDSPGGEVYAGLKMIDAVQSYKYPIKMYCTGTAASMAAVLLACGQKGRRFSLPHSRVMIHEPLISSGFAGSATTVEKTAKSLLEVRELINGILAEQTDKTIEEINSATVFDNFMSAKDAVEFGICDEIRNIFD